MTDTKHTAGPYVWVSSDAGPNDEYGCATSGPIDLTTWQSKGYLANPELIGSNGKVVLSAGSGEYCPFKGTTPEEARANAYLIAAAPELLAACKAALIAATEPVPLHEVKIRAEEVRETLRAAIAKATGK